MSAASVPDTCAVARRLSQRSRSSVSMAPWSLRRSFRQRACASCRSVATGGTSAATAGSMRTWSSRGFRAEWSARTGGRGGSSCGSSPGRGCPSPMAPSTPSTRSTCSSTSCRGTVIVRHSRDTFWSLPAPWLLRRAQSRCCTSPSRSLCTLEAPRRAPPVVPRRRGLPRGGVPRAAPGRRCLP